DRTAADKTPPPAPRRLRELRPLGRAAVARSAGRLHREPVDPPEAAHRRGGDGRVLRGEPVRRAHLSQRPRRAAAAGGRVAARPRAGAGEAAARNRAGAAVAAHRSGVPSSVRLALTTPREVVAIARAGASWRGSAEAAHAKPSRSGDGTLRARDGR